MPEVKMPQLGETVVEGTITKWLKQEGDTVEEDELLVEISTDKVDSEVPSSIGGVLKKILVPEGETVSVGTALAVIEGEGESGGSAEEASTDAPKAEAEPEAESQEKPDEGAGGRMPESSEAVEKPAARAEEAPAKEPARREPEPEPEEKAPAASGDTSKRGIISPLVRRLADENDINLDEVSGSGTGGRIRKQDVMRFIEERKGRPAAERPAAVAVGGGPAPAPRREAPEPAREPGTREELVPWTNIRRRTAEHMVASSRTVARAWNAVEADWTNIVRIRGAAKEGFKAAEGFNLTFMPFLCKAVCDTLMEMPELNATFDEEHQANLVKRYVNLGIAVALEGGGLIVPVIRDADGKNLAGLARSINDIATRARTKKLTPDDLAGGTFTITNPGPFGSKLSVPIIPQGQTAILAFEAIEKRVVVTDDDSIAIRSRGFLPLSWDHRIIDGAEAARFLQRLAERIETTDFTADLGQYL
jgi:2-oxoglutarate dehydrogenase E2 component (dihydrolipoamide succinyltransferase)